MKVRPFEDFATGVGLVAILYFLGRVLVAVVWGL